MHFDLEDAIALTGFAAATFDIKRESTCLITPFTSGRNSRKEFSNGSE
jgi:hypothetical protein